jgi:hypothetical protein
MSKGITAFEKVDYIYDGISNLNKAVITDDEDDYEQVAKEMARVLDNKEDIGRGGKCSNNSSNNHSFIELNPQIWDSKDDRRDDSLVFYKNFEKIKKQKKRKNKKQKILLKQLNEGNLINSVVVNCKKVKILLKII